MDKVLVEVYVPASRQTHDVFIPLESKIHEVLLLVANAMTELSEGYFQGSYDTIVCDRSTGSILDINKTVEETGLTNGAKLMLV
ncbi:methyltransferase [Radiobacillus kanasensis]|uniref:methyltransferase n=1 Tax=Radiobacillus kanasensis TaxID=2844358 RepID=UPI001E55C321|nr:methyltransferase [Radiobacillus kanasensis]UFT99207.1 methyltransferase [Radiobacillus kanasensis]